MKAFPALFFCCFFFLVLWKMKNGVGETQIKAVGGWKKFSLCCVCKVVDQVGEGEEEAWKLFLDMYLSVNSSEAEEEERGRGGGRKSIGKIGNGMKIKIMLHGKGEGNFFFLKKKFFQLSFRSLLACQNYWYDENTPFLV